MVFTSSTQNRHIPVMLMETLENLKIKENGIYVDGTIGLGGHSEIIIKKIDTGLLIGIDRDKDSISIANKRLPSNKNFKLIHDSYQNLKIILKELKVEAVDGILLYLGLSLKFLLHVKLNLQNHMNLNQLIFVDRFYKLAI